MNWQRAAAIILIGGVLAGPAQAERPLTPPAPELPAHAPWINASSLSLARLKKRKAVLIAFINTASINSLRALRILNAWNTAFAPDGFMLIGVHTPIYEFQKDPSLMKRSLKRLNVDFPVILDNDRQSWKEYANEGWPAFYLVDHKGRIVFDRLGEGGYAELEEEIRAAIARAPGQYDPPDAAPIAKDAPTKECGGVTPETRLGTIGRTPILKKNSSHMVVATAGEGEVSYFGSWRIETDTLRLLSANPDSSHSIHLVYRGAEAFAVLEPGGEHADRFYIRQDDLWLHPGNAGTDVRFDDDGRSYVTVSDPRLYKLTRNPDNFAHELSLAPTQAGSAVYAFSFSDRCMAGTY